MIGFIKAMAETYGWGWTIAILIYVIGSSIVSLLVVLDTLFGGQA